MATNPNEWWATRNVHVEGVANTHYMIRPLLKSTLRRMEITDEARASFGFAFRTSLELWEAQFGDRFFDMMTMIRLASAIDTGLRDFYMKRMGFSKLAELKRAVGRLGNVFQRLNPGQPNDAVELFRRDVGIDLTAIPRFEEMRLVMEHRHLYAHNLGVVDERYIERIQQISGEDVRTRLVDYPAEDVYFWGPLSELDRFIEAARVFFKALPAA